MNLWHERHIYASKDLKTTFYEAEKEGNPSLSGNATLFCEDIREIVKTTAGFITDTIKAMNAEIEEPSNSKKSN